MSTVYVETDTNSDLNLNTVSAPANSKTLLQTAPGAGTSQTITLPSSGSLLFAYFITEPADPGTTGGSGAQNYSATFNVTTANMNLSLNQLILARLNSSGVQQATAGFAVATADPQTTGVKSYGPTSMNLGTWAAGDRLALRMTLSNGAMADSSFVVEVGLGSGNEQVTAPWTFAAATAIPDIIMAPPR